MNAIEWYVSIWIDKVLFYAITDHYTLLACVYGVALRHKETQLACMHVIM